MAWFDDLEKSMDNFDTLIRPILPQLINGEFIRVEGSPEEIAQTLDKNIGIDAMIKTGDIYYGLGSRIQENSGVWNSFTIRCERESGHITELEKLRKAIARDAMRPHLTMQAYITHNELKSIAVARTKDIIEYIDTHTCKTNCSWDSETGSYARFVVVWWDDMKNAQYPIKILDFRNTEEVA